MTSLYLKAVHIIFIVTWFAGLFYMPRLLIYLTESSSKSEPERSILHNSFYSWLNGFGSESRGPQPSSPSRWEQP
jgi:uncharacterized membrane protein